MDARDRLGILLREQRRAIADIRAWNQRHPEAEPVSCAAECRLVELLERVHAAWFLPEQTDRWRELMEHVREHPAGLSEAAIAAFVVLAD